jgi:urease accessory protein UreE
MPLVNLAEPALALAGLSTVLVARPRSRRECFALAIELGNLHVPVEITTDAILVAPDGPVEEVLERMGVPWEIRVITPGGP